MLNISKKQSFFLFGPRGTGKTTLLKSVFTDNSSSDEVIRIDLLDDELFDLYLRNPARLKNEIDALKKKPSLVIIDEVQRLPRILTTIHKMIEEDGVVLALTGSSARKLKRGAANLLAGRAFLYSLFPLSCFELEEAFDLDQVLRYGSLPKIFQFERDSDKEKFLKTYALTYLKEEIVAEQITRKLEPFREFLEIAAQMNGKIINYASIARDVGVDIIKPKCKVDRVTRVQRLLNW
jgi:predicted AAA+ superfamily ATPase